MTMAKGFGLNVSDAVVRLICRRYGRVKSLLTEIARHFAPAIQDDGKQYDLTVNLT